MDLLKSVGRVAVMAIIFYSLMFFGVSYAHDIKSAVQDAGQYFPSPVVSLGDADYNWNLKTLDGKDFSLQSARGKVVLINIWATWCPPCVQEMPSFQKLYNQFKNKIIFVFASDEDPETLNKFLTMHGYRLPIYIYKQLPGAYETDGVPTTFIISSDGKIIHRELGGPLNWNTQKTVDFLRSLNNK